MRHPSFFHIGNFSVLSLTAFCEKQSQAQYLSIISVAILIEPAYL